MPNKFHPLLGINKSIEQQCGVNYAVFMEQDEGAIPVVFPAGRPDRIWARRQEYIGNRHWNSWPFEIGVNR